MISRKTSIVIAIVLLIIFAFMTVETIGNSSSSISTSTVKPSPSSLSVYLPQNGSAIPVTQSTSSLTLNMSVTSSEPTVYIYDLILNNSPIQNFTHFNLSKYPYNYMTVSVNPGVNETVQITLVFNLTDLSEMNYSYPPSHIVPYPVSLLIENSVGASFTAFAVLKLPS